MKAILLFFLFVIIFIIGILFSKVKVSLQFVQDISPKCKNKYEFKIIIYILIFHKIKLIKITIDSKKQENKTKKRQYRYNKDVIKILSNSKIKLEQLWLEINFDTQNVFITTFLTVIISTLISSILTKNIFSINYNKCKYTVNPLYQNKNSLNLRLNCIIVGDFVHISTMLYKLIKKVRNDKNERTSNRGTYEYSNE